MNLSECHWASSTTNKPSDGSTCPWRKSPAWHLLINWYKRKSRLHPGQVLPPDRAALNGHEVNIPRGSTEGFGKFVLQRRRERVRCHLAANEVAVNVAGRSERQRIVQDEVGRAICRNFHFVILVRIIAGNKFIFDFFKKLEFKPFLIGYKNMTFLKWLHCLLGPGLNSEFIF